MTRRRLLTLAVTLTVLLGLIPSTFHTFATGPAQTVIRVLVKVRSPLAKDIETALPLPKMVLVPGPPGDTHVEAFLARHSVRKAAPLYPEIVKVKKVSGLSDLQISSGIRDRFAKRANRLRAAFQPPEISRTYILELDGALRKRLPEILADLNADPDVEFAEEDKIVSVNLTPNDPYFSSSGTWG